MDRFSVANSSHLLEHLSSMRVMTLNLAHGRRRGFHQPLVRRSRAERNLADIGHVLRREQPHVAALQEADGPSFWSGRFDHVAHLAGLSGYAHHHRGEHSAAGRGRPWLTTGTALLARSPLREPASHTFEPVLLRPTKGLVVASVEFAGHAGRPVTVASVHLDFLRRGVRLEQVRALAAVLQQWQPPYVILGDMNCSWEGRETTLRLLGERLGVRPFEPAADLATFPSRWPRWRLDWILLSPDLAFRSYAVLPDHLSDHRAVVADLAFA